MAIVVPIATDYDPSGVKQATTEFQLFGQAMEKTFQQAASNARKAFDHVESSAVGASKQLKNTADNADRSRSVFANFAGNAAQEIPGLTGAFGPLNVAIGQFTEYATEGNIKLAGFAKSVGIMAALAGALVIVNKQLDNVRQNRSFREESVTGYFEQLKQGLPVVEAIVNKLKEGAEIRVSQGGIGGLLGLSETKNILPTLVRFNITARETASIVNGGAQAINARIDALRKSGATVQQVNDVEKFLYNQLRDTTSALTEQRLTAKFLAETTGLAIPPTNGFAEAIGVLEAKSFGASKALEITQQQIQNLRDEVLASVNAEFAYADAVDNQTTAIARAKKARAEANKTRKPEDIRAAERAERDAAKAVIGTAAAFGELAAENNKAATGLDDATVSAIGFYNQLQTGAAQFRPGGSIRQPLDEIITRLQEGFPPEIRTRIVFDFVTGQVSRTGSIGDPTGGRTGLVGVTVPTVTSNASAGSNVNVNVSGFVGSNTQLAEEIRRILNNSANRRGSSGGFLS